MGRRKRVIFGGPGFGFAIVVVPGFGFPVRHDRFPSGRDPPGCSHSVRCAVIEQTTIGRTEGCSPFFFFTIPLVLAICLIFTPVTRVVLDAPSNCIADGIAVAVIDPKMIFHKR